MRKQKRTFSPVFLTLFGEKQPKQPQSLGWLQRGLLIQLLPPKETGNAQPTSNCTPSWTALDLCYSKTFCYFQIYRRTPEQWAETKAAGFPVGCAQPRLLAQNWALALAEHHYKRDKGATKQIPAQRRDWRLDLGQYNSLQQQVETISKFLAFRTLQMGREDTNSDALEWWVSHTGHRRQVLLLHMGINFTDRPEFYPILAVLFVSTKTSTTNVLIINSLSVHFSHAAR